MKTTIYPVSRVTGMVHSYYDHDCEYVDNSVDISHIPVEFIHERRENVTLIYWDLRTEPPIFEGTLTFLEFVRLASSNVAKWKNSDNKIYTMSLTNLEDLIKTKKPINQITGIWTWSKEGQFYGIKLIE